ncbi:putative 2-aminoethylphosphonate ABC transporter ATP-binding protein [Ectobacillus sp. JY-23]|uniref:putative 2-aminoethylphosphonate ABC transporter ATP-binding protein n=1 Tax=Ectobacillus sp. JY-23 TaxID=2933872 RepID=UPI001FF512D7|nr:putative 2-aminoethylphosphonate ABC transporter ATP-binding protein [Ectobacillus sp. JY-23]UOY91900.1 putative 2-aminoethylphosphonate ABC transporter ATP-binding protein [Ectobacillus sp. JY-23]
MSQPYLSIEHVNKQFGQFTALKDISFEVEKNEFVCLLGPSGCGKTTLLRTIAGLEKPTTGKIYVGGRDITALPPSKRNFGIVFQSYALFPNLTALQNIEFGLKAKKLPKNEVRERALENLGFVDLLHAKDKYPAQMSGGQQQRVALARALALSPDFLLLDEPLSALDAKVREKLRYEIRSIQQKVGITTIMVTHDQEEALTMADKIVVMNNGEIAQVGTPQEIYHTPANPFVANFIGSINFFKEGSDQHLLAIRPEHIRIDKEDGISVVVENIEFRGPVYRALVRVQEESSFLHNELITVDVSATQHIHLHIGMKQSISFSKNHMLSYEEKVMV